MPDLSPTSLLVDAAGALVDRATPLLRADDLGVLRGDGAFEALLVVDGVAMHLDAHLDRLERSAHALGLALPPRAGWAERIQVASEAWTGGREMVVRLLVTRGVHEGGPPTAWLLADPLADALARQRADGVRALTLDRGTDPTLVGRAPWLLFGVKYLSYALNMAALRWARDQGVDEVIWTGPDGLVLEAPTSAVVAVRGTHLASPPVDVGILASVTLADLFARAAATGWSTADERLRVDDLFAADAVWLVSSTRLATRVRALDGIELPDRSGADLLTLVSPPG